MVSLQGTGASSAAAPLRYSAVYSVKKCFLTFHPTSCLGHSARPGRWLTGYMMQSRMYRTNTNTSAPYNSLLPTPPPSSSSSSLAAGWTVRKLNRKSCARCFMCALVKHAGCFPLTFSVWVQVGGFSAASIPLLQEFRLQDGVKAAHFKCCCIKFAID